MTFNSLDAGVSTVVLDAFGSAVEYHKVGGVVAGIQAIIDKDVDVFGFDSVVAEKRTEITLLSSDAPHIRRGEKIVNDGTVYEIQDTLEDDGVMVRVIVK